MNRSPEKPLVSSSSFYRKAVSLAEGMMPNNALNPDASPAALVRRPLGAG